MKRVVRDAAAMVQGVSDALVEAVLESAHRPFTVALSGGSTPQKLYESLATREGLDWGALELFFGDERAVPPEDKDSNYRMAKAALLDRVAVRAHRMRALEGAADEYEALLRERVPTQREGVPSLDLVLLGMGPDGHTASLFPGTAALDEKSKLVVMNEVPQMHTRRMTVTYPLLAAAKRVWILVSGRDKAPMLARALGPGSELPIQRVAPAGELVWWVDEAADKG